jgi:hypothetical protein
MSIFFGGIPATSVPNERVFSTAGDIDTTQRSSLKGNFAKKYLFTCFSLCINMDVYMYISVLLCWIRE